MDGLFGLVTKAVPLRPTGRRRGGLCRHAVARAKPESLAELRLPAIRLVGPILGALEGVSIGLLFFSDESPSFSRVAKVVWIMRRIYLHRRSQLGHLVGLGGS